MNEKEKLINLSCAAGWNLFTDSNAINQVADHLTAKNVAIPPVNVGQTVYLVRCPFNHELFVSEEIIEKVRIEYTKDGILRKFGNRSFEAYDIDLGETVFTDKKAAEAKLAAKKAASRLKTDWK